MVSGRDLRADLPVLAQWSSLESRGSAAFALQVRSEFHWNELLAILLGPGFALHIQLYLADLMRIRGKIQSAVFRRKVGNLEIIGLEGSASPLAFRWFQNKYVFVPVTILENARFYHIAPRHEIQHHRQGDTIWAHANFLLQALQSSNPLVYWLRRRMNDISEMASDVALQAYSNCLVAVAEHSLSTRAEAAVAMGRAGNQLKRRIETMFSKPKQLRKNSLRLAMALCTTGITTLAFATSFALHEDPKHSLANGHLKLDTASPLIETNEEVIAKLNLYVGTKSGMEFSKKAVMSLREKRKVFEDLFEDQAIPQELLALAFVESGLQNLPQAEREAKTAGIWQLTPETARRLGLKIEAGNDERLELAKATAATLNYLRILQQEFSDWRLAIMAYNLGEARLRREIEEAGTQDPWQLIRRIDEHENGYLPRVMAAMIIIRNPKLLE